VAKKKLTLSVEERVIRRAKRFSAQHQTTVSQLVTEFLASLEEEDRAPAPIVSKLRGVLPTTIDREHYREHLRTKYGR
jgi:hypothetical protein